MILFCAAAAAVLVIDMLTKHIVSSGMALGSSITVIPGIFDLTYILNDGAAWGILSGRQALLQLFTAVLMIGILVYAIVKRKSLKTLEMLSLGLILGGGLGNFISRVFSGQVVDFLNIHIIPVFNAADIGITVGCVLLIIAELLPQKKE